MFRVNSEGDLIAVLGEGVLIYCDIWTRQYRTVPVDSKATSLNFYKNCAVVSGFLHYYTIMTPGGKELKTVSLDYPIRQVKAVPRTERVLIYNENIDIVCANIDGGVEWLLGNYRVHGEIQASENGLNCCFIRRPNTIVQFDISGESCFEATEPSSVSQLSLSLDGKFLLVLDVDNRLTLMDDKLKPVWDSASEHLIRLIRISRKGDYFLTVDRDNILTCYGVRSTGKTSSEFLELQMEKRVTDKLTTWSVRPGRPYRENELHHLSVNPTGSCIGAVGMGNSAHFLDDGGQRCVDVSLPAHIVGIGFNDSFSLGYICGDRQIKVVDFDGRKDNYAVFSEPFHHRPMINFYHRKFFLISADNDVLVYDFAGKRENSFRAPGAFRKGLSCEGHGIVLCNDREMIAYTATGEVSFRHTTGTGILEIHYSEGRIFCVTKDSSLLSVDLSERKGGKRKLTEGDTPVSIVSLTPLLVVDGRNNLYHLGETLETRTRRPVRSDDSLFYMDGEQLCEITRSRRGFKCYDGDDDMIWRYRSDAPIKESALTRIGLAFIVGDTVHCIALRDGVGTQSDYSDYLEMG